MDRSAEAYQGLLSELSLAWAHIENQYHKTRDMTGRVEAGSREEHDWAALGYTIHNFYNALENYFLRVAKFFENALDATTWHKDLVDRMSLQVAGVRPALIAPKERRSIHELRSFRHVFRNIYDAELDPDRVERVNRLVPEVMAIMKTRRADFEKKIESIAERLAP